MSKIRSMKFIFLALLIASASILLPRAQAQHTDAVYNGWISAYQVTDGSNFYLAKSFTTAPPASGARDISSSRPRTPTSRAAKPHGTPRSSNCSTTSSPRMAPTGPATPGTTISNGSSTPSSAGMRSPATPATST